MTLERLADEIINRLTIEIEASGRHVHLTRGDVEYLFGVGHQLTPVKPLSQLGQFVCAERVTVRGPKGELRNVVVLGPERGESQVEISMTDGVALGVTPPVRQSGDLPATPGITIIRDDRALALPRGLIVAQRHIHMTPEDAAKFGVNDGQTVRFQCLTGRPVILEDTVVRVSSKFTTFVHLDYDEANACGYRKGDRGYIM